MEGWNEDLSDVKNVSDLPYQARTYIDKLEETTGVSISIVSLGASREKVIFLKNNAF